MATFICPWVHVLRSHDTQLDDVNIMFKDGHDR